MLQKIGLIRMTDNKKIDNDVVNFDKAFDNILSKMKDRIEREIPDTGYFRDFSEHIGREKPLDIYAKDVALFVERDGMRDGRAFLGVSVLHPDMSVGASEYLINRDRQGLLKELNRPEYVQEIKDQVLKLAESLKNQ